MAFVAEAYRYPHSPDEVLSGFSPEDRAIILRAAECMKSRPKHQHARRARCAEAVVEDAVPQRSDERRHIRLLGAAGSYAKAMEWWAPKPGRLR